MGRGAVKWTERKAGIGGQDGRMVEEGMGGEGRGGTGSG